MVGIDYLVTMAAAATTSSTRTSTTAFNVCLMDLFLELFQFRHDFSLFGMSFYSPDFLPVNQSVLRVTGCGS